MSTLNNIFQILLQYNTASNNDQLKHMAVIGVALLIVWKFRKQIILALTAAVVFVFFFAKEMILAIYPDTLNESQKVAFTIALGIVMAVIATKNYMKNS
ncbi:hypothetical protein BKI52_04485 [marine bacterium AO1-C]|nr:hypothetical protein BKI52_04485 [marine bacterium AO1-C]